MSGLLSRLFSIGKGKVNEAGEAIVDKNAITIFEQQLREAEADLAKAKDSLTSVMADKTIATNKLNDIKSREQTMLGHAKAAKEKGEEALMHECVQAVADAREEMATQQALVDQLTESASAIEAQVRQTEGNIRELKRRTNAIKANDRLLKAEKSLSKHSTGANGSVSSALDSLARIDEKQAHARAKIDAQREMSQTPEEALNAKLAASGIGSTRHSTADILSELD